MLAETAYGKSNVRLVQVSRHGDRHDLKDLTVAIRFEGEYDQSYTEGDNRDVLPTDTMKNTVYALAARHPVEEPETFGRLLAEHFLERNPRLRRVRIELTEHQWGRIAVKAREHGQAFVRHGTESRTATVEGEGDQFTIGAGVSDLVILKSSHSAFAGFLRDEYTTLPEAADRILATALTASWRYRTADLDFNLTWRAVRTTLLEAFGNTTADRYSIPSTTWARPFSTTSKRSPASGWSCRTSTISPWTCRAWASRTATRSSCLPMNPTG